MTPRGPGKGEKMASPNRAHGGKKTLPHTQKKWRTGAHKKGKERRAKEQMSIEKKEFSNGPADWNMNSLDWDACGVEPTAQGSNKKGETQYQSIGGQSSAPGGVS